MADIGKVEPVEITEEMQRSYLNYSMSVIVARALPDVKDGLKPVQRRIIYAMYKLGITSHASFTKCAKIVGEVLGKYHPHGDGPVYEALVRLAQDFNMRYPLIWGQGNFGSIDGDSPAAMRYTECKLATISDELLKDIEKNTVAWGDNFDGSLKEPLLLPSILPNLLLNGASGIAVGMATNIPPHNITETIDAIMFLIDNPDASLEDLMGFIKGPDFPSGGQIFDISEIKQAYATGKGKIMMRAKTDIEETKSGKFQIIVTELPYQVNKASLIIKIADLVKDKKVEGISDLRDESDRRGMRIVIELKRDAKPQSLLNNLYKHTNLQQSFPVNMVGLIDGTPQTLTLKIILDQYILHRQTVITKRSQFELDEARKREHVLLGLKIAVDNIDAVIETIKKSKDADTAKVNLMQKFKLTEIQSTAILDMQLRRLAALERQKIEDELSLVRETITYLEELLANHKKILQVVKKELERVKDKFGDDRKTKVFKQKIGEFSEEDLIPDEACIVTLTKGGYIKRQDLTAFRTQNRGGKGVTGITTKEEDFVFQLFSCRTHDDIVFFSDKGKVYKLKVYDLPEGSRIARGQAIVNLIDIAQDEKILSVLPSRKSDATKFIFMVTKNGVVKKTEIKAYESIRRSGIIAIKLAGDDQLRWAKPSTGNDEIFLVSQNGLSIRFSEKGVRPMGRDTMGVKGINLKNGDEIIGMDVLAQNDLNAHLLVIMEKGLGKRTAFKEWPKQLRGGSGVKAAQVTDRTGKLVSARVVTEEDEALVLTSQSGQLIRLPLKSVPKLGRPTQGVTLIRLKPGDKVAAAATVKRTREETGTIEPPGVEDKKVPKRETKEAKPASGKVKVQPK
ncbi:MAG TPA: DNA gyrase subunit A, partial [Patescibacteria group bacterium]